MTTLVRERDVTAGRHTVERRDPTTRALRSMVAAWFDIHPRTLAALTDDTVDRMARRLEGRRIRCPAESDDLLGHPWAG